MFSNVSFCSCTFCTSYIVPEALFSISINPKGIKLLTRLRLGLTHLYEYMFKYTFQDSLNPI